MKEYILLLILLVGLIQARKIDKLWKKKNGTVDLDPEFEYTTEQVPRIVGGEPTDIKFFPYQLSVRHFDYHICGASIIAESFALTLASCLEFTPPEQITFLAGATDIFEASNGLVSKASRYFFHPEYDFETYDFDIVIVEVRTPFIGENIQPIMLATQNMQVYEGRTAVVAGWGDTNDGNVNTILHKVDIPVVNHEKCAQAWDGKITDTAICAGKAYLDTCSSDNGGALVYCGLQIGINLRNSENCDGEKPAVFTSIAHPKIRSFIRRHTGC